MLPVTALGNIWDMLPIKSGSDPGAHEFMWHREGFAVSVVKSSDSYTKARIQFS